MGRGARKIYDLRRGACTPAKRGYRIRTPVPDRGSTPPVATLIKYTRVVRAYGGAFSPPLISVLWKLGEAGGGLRRGWVSSQQLISPPGQRKLHLLPELINLVIDL
jgi:hypothetical protein